MSKQYIDVPIYTSFNDISVKNFSLSATQHKKFCINNNQINQNQSWANIAMIITFIFQ